MSTTEIIKSARQKMDKAVAAVGHEFSGVRTGRATGAIFEKITVDYYGAATPLLQIAGVKTPEAQLLVIEPYDKTALKAIEHAIQASDLGLNPSNDGLVIRVPFPPLTEERRRELVKLCKQYTEEGRNAVRNIRRDAKKHLEASEKEHEISEDDLDRAEAEVQKLTDSHIHDLDELLKRKEAEIMEV
jgi:ribosome recycling factor